MSIFEFVPGWNDIEKHDASSLRTARELTRWIGVVVDLRAILSFCRIGGDMSVVAQETGPLWRQDGSDATATILGLHTAAVITYGRLFAAQKNRTKLEHSHLRLAFEGSDEEAALRDHKRVMELRRGHIAHAGATHVRVHALLWVQGEAIHAAHEFHTTGQTTEQLAVINGLAEPLLRLALGRRDEAGQNLIAEADRLGLEAIKQLPRHAFPAGPIEW